MPLLNFERFFSCVKDLRNSTLVENKESVLGVKGGRYLSYQQTQWASVAKLPHQEKRLSKLL